MRYSAYKVLCSHGSLFTFEVRDDSAMAFTRQQGTNVNQSSTVFSTCCFCELVLRVDFGSVFVRFFLPGV